MGICGNGQPCSNCCTSSLLPDVDTGDRRAGSARLRMILLRISTYMYGTEPDTLRYTGGCNVSLCRLQRLCHTTQGLLLQRRSIPVLLYIASRKRTQHSLPCTSQGLYGAEVPLRHITTNLVGTAALTKHHSSARHFSGMVDCCCMALWLADMYLVFEVLKACLAYVTAAEGLRCDIPTPSTLSA